MAKRNDQSHIVEEQNDGSYKCTEGDWETKNSDTQARDAARRHENDTFGMG
jgi:hypothetical protein